MVSKHPLEAAAGRPAHHEKGTPLLFPSREQRLRALYAELDARAATFDKLKVETSDPAYQYHRDKVNALTEEIRRLEEGAGCGVPASLILAALIFFALLIFANVR
ncbi:hypothetical protein [Streptomyces katrae]|uniref:Uncharacterized protein n=1 Tax=Streptomyces katrae TaxID=68223 RepID=A0A0F4JS08_9ACTN|nr:hypothetical protein [Streptomyces katrae]KJY37152.1 hypothetical protein VR44_06420 [Streptomyces katrae]